MNTGHNSWNPNAPRILCISPAFAPKRDSEAFCSTKFIKALTECGAQITVIVYAKKEGDIDQSEMWNSVRATVVRIPPVAQRNPFASVATAVRYQTWLYARWTGEAVRQAKGLYQKSLFDVVYSRSLPMFGQIAGYWCAKELNIPWIANLNDPWDFHQFPVGVSKEDLTNDSALSDFWMRRTLRNADLVTYPSDRLRDYQTNLSMISHHSQIIPHVGNGHVFQESGVNGNASNFRLVHAGKLGSNELTGRSTAALLDGLSLFLNDCGEARNQVRLTLVGAEDQATQARIRQLGLEATVESVGLIDYEDSLKYIQSATACLLVEGEMSEGIFLPSKLVDYISARKPILALSPRVGVVADLASRGGITRVDAADAHGIRDAIRGLYEDFRKGTLARRSPSGAQVDQFRPDLVASRFLETLRELIAERKESKLQRA
jgi:glycosyltransferase involved in cell wall biosynthesis